MPKQPHDGSQEISLVNKVAIVELDELINSSVRLPFIIKRPGLILNLVFSLGLDIGTLRRRSRGKRKAGEHEDGLDGMALESTQIILDLGDNGKRETSSRSNQWLTGVGVGQEVVEIMGSINTKSCVGKRGDWTALYELPLFEIVFELMNTM